MGKYYIELYNKETNEEVFMIKFNDGKFDAAKEPEYADILLADVNHKNGIRIWDSLEERREKVGK